MAEAEALPLDKERLSKLGAMLRSRFSEYDKARRSAEDQWLKNVRQYIGTYDASVLSGLTANQSRAYPRLTRVKVLSLVARLHALLFPAGEKNWGVEASPQPMLPADKLVEILNAWVAANPGAVATQAEIDRVVKVAANEIATHMETVIDDQLKDSAAAGACDYQGLVRKVLFAGSLYGCGVLKGPMTIEQAGSVIVVDSAGVPQVISAPMYRPYFEFVNTFDYYPDLSAKAFGQMDGQFERHIYSRYNVSQLVDREDFMGEAISEYLRVHPTGNYMKKNFEQELDRLSDEQRQRQPQESSKFELIEYWGSVSGHDLRAAGVQVPDSELAKNAIACVWMLDDTVIKVAKSPYETNSAMYHQFVFEEDEVNLMGSGLPAIMRDSQMGVSSFTRMLVDNASSVCGPNIEVDIDQLASSVNPNTVTPFKAWVKDNASPNGARAVQNISFDSHIPELLQAIELMRGFADVETFINPMTGGDMENVPSEALRTQGNMSMAMGAAALPFKDIVRSFDKFTTSVIGSLVQWNLVYHEQRESLRGDLRPLPKGASSLMAKEVRAYTLDNLARTLTPEERLYINEEELLKERLSARDLPLEKLMAAPEEVKRRKDAAAAQAQKAEQQADAQFQANLRTAQTESVKDVSQAQKNMDMADVAVTKALLDAIEKGANIDELRRLTTGANAAQTAGKPAADQGVAEQPAEQLYG